MNKKNIPPRTAERFFLYVRFLKAKQSLGAENVFSHELSLAVGISPEQVRQDLMLLNIRGTPQKGYQIKSFLADLQNFLSMDIPIKAIMIGEGELGRALKSYFSVMRPNLQIISVFDSDISKKEKKSNERRVYNSSEIQEIIRREKPLIGIIAVSPEGAQQLADDLAREGIKGLVNFTSALIKPPSGVFLENVDMLMSLEKTAFFSRNV